MKRAARWVQATWEDQLARLRALGVQASELHPESAELLFRRFASDFVGPERAAELLERGRDRAYLDLERWTRPECTEPTRAEGSLHWLRAGHGDARCVRFDRRRRLPSLEIDIVTLEDAWAASWPGAFVNFDGARALLVSVDYEAYRCDLRGLPRTPYR